MNTPIDDELVEKMLVDVELGKPLTDKQYFLLSSVVAFYREARKRIERDITPLDRLSRSMFLLEEYAEKTHAPTNRI